MCHTFLKSVIVKVITEDISSNTSIFIKVTSIVGYFMVNVLIIVNHHVFVNWCIVLVL